MAKVLTGISGNLISAASAGFAPTNSADVSAIASAYQVVSSTATQLYAGSSYVTSVNDAPLSASRAGNAANASLANSAWYDGTGRLISALPDSATVSAIASAYAESAASGKLDSTAQVVTSIDYAASMISPDLHVQTLNGYGLVASEAYSAHTWIDASSKQDTLTFSYDDNKISAINGSALAGQGGGAVTSVQSALDPWYGTSISGLNGSSLYPKWAESAKSSQKAFTADWASNAQSAGAAPTAWASSFITGVSSPSGTIRVLGGTAIEGTNSALLPSTVIEGFSTSYAGGTVGPSQKLHCVLPTANPSTELLMPFLYNTGRVVWSSNNGGGDWVKDTSPETITAQIPNATAVDIWVDNAWIQVGTVTASAATQESGGGVAELAWASALPTYSYDAEDKISAINGSAIAGGGGGGVDSATVSAIASAYAESAVSSVSSNYYTTANESGFLTAQAQVSWSESASASPSYIQDKPDLVDIVAGPGIVVDNPDGNTLRVSMAQNYETVLCDTVSNSSCTLSEAYTNFERIRIEWQYGSTITDAEYSIVPMLSEYYTDAITATTNKNVLMTVTNLNGNGSSAGQFVTRAALWKFNGTTTFEFVKGYQLFNGNITASTAIHIRRIVGIHRIAGGN